MFGKIKIFLDRVSTMSFKKMFSLIKQISKEFNKSSVLILADMIFCAVKYGMGYQDYKVFGFAELSGSERRSFLMMSQNLNLARKLNDPEKKQIFINKDKFFDYFSVYVGRDWINLKNSTAEDFERFCKYKKAIFVKPTDLFGGQGVKKIVLDDNTDRRKLYDELISTNEFIAEEVITQHKKMKVLYPHSLNTLRITTITVDGVPHIIYKILRIGQGGSCVDNITSGGMYAPVGDDGKVARPAFCNKNGLSFDTHPETGTPIVGFEIPHFDEAVELVKEAATILPEVGYVGWDIGITPEGPIIVEGNHLPAYDLPQNYLHRQSREGMLYRIEEIVGCRL